MLPSCLRSASLVGGELICIASQGREDVIKMLISWSHLDVKYPAKVFSLWPSPGFFEMLSGKYNTDSCSKEEEIDYLVIYVSHGLHPDKEQWHISAVIKASRDLGWGDVAMWGTEVLPTRLAFMSMEAKILNTVRDSCSPMSSAPKPDLQVCGDASICQTDLVRSLQ
jgi:hypothetical protein